MSMDGYSTNRNNAYLAGRGREFDERWARSRRNSWGESRERRGKKEHEERLITDAEYAKGHEHNLTPGQKEWIVASWDSANGPAPFKVGALTKIKARRQRSCSARGRSEVDLRWCATFLDDGYKGWYEKKVYEEKYLYKLRKEKIFSFLKGLLKRDEKAPIKEEPRQKIQRAEIKEPEVIIHEERNFDELLKTIQEKVGLLKTKSMEELRDGVPADVDLDKRDEKLKNITYDIQRSTKDNNIKITNKDFLNAFAKADAEFRLGIQEESQKQGGY